MLDAANRIIDISNVAQDRALALQVQGKVQIAQGDLKQGLATLATARVAFDATGNQFGADEVRAELHRYQND